MTLSHNYIGIVRGQELMRKQRMLNRYFNKKVAQRVSITNAFSPN